MNELLDGNNITTFEEFGSKTL